MNTSLEQRLEMVEAAIAELKQQQNPDPNWVEQITGSFKDDPIFDEVLAFCRKFRHADRPKDDSSTKIKELANMVLNIAIGGKNKSLVLDLLNLGADVNYVNVDSEIDCCANTPLMTAAVTNNVDMLKLLVQHGADPKLEFDDGCSWCNALGSAMWEDTPDAFQYLLNFYKDDPAYINNLFKNAISLSDVNFSLVEQLIIGGCDVNAKFERGGTPLIEAVRSGFVKPIRFLVESGADVNLADDRELTPLLWATYYDIQEAIDYLSPLTSLEIKNLIQKQLSDELALEKLLFPEIV
jgi:ankyrin repeat protein